MQGVPQLDAAMVMPPGCSPNIARFSLDSLLDQHDGRNISICIDWQTRRTTFQVEYDNIDGAQGFMRAANDAAAVFPLARAQDRDRNDAPCRKGDMSAAYPRTHQMQHHHGPLPIDIAQPSSAPRDVTVSPDSNTGSRQTARRTGQLVLAESSSCIPAKAEKVKSEKVKSEKVKSEKVKSELKVKAEKTVKRSTHTVKQEKILYPEKGNAVIRNSKKRTYWYKSQYHKPLPKPPSGLSPRRAALYVHHHNDGKQIWLWDEVSDDELEEGSPPPKYEWKRVREGISHPHPSLPEHVMHVIDDGTPRWVLATSRRKRLQRKKKCLEADVDLAEE